MDSRNDSSELIHPGNVRDRFPGILRVSRQLEGLRTVERDRGTGLAQAVTVCTLKGCFLCSLCFGIFGCGCRGDWYEIGA